MNQDFKSIKFLNDEATLATEETWIFFLIMTLSKEKNTYLLLRENT